MSFTNNDTEAVNNIRVLAADVVQKANSGHPGMPMGMAPIAHVLWNKVMKFNPKNSKWLGRDRFVLSNGHGCALLYIMLHLSGFDLSIDDLKKFRQLHSKTPGHPENFQTEGIEVTTGPLGQGIANGVGLAIAERNLAANYNKEGFNVVDNHTYVFCGDGCLQEGVSGEASSMAGHLGLGKLIVLYDDNKITIDGDTNLSFSEDVLMRYRSYGWHTSTVLNGDTNLGGLHAAIEDAKKVTDKPSIIAIKTTIGYGSSKQGKESSHGAPLGDKDISNVKAKFGFSDEKFAVSKATRELYDPLVAKGAKAEVEWDQLMAAYCSKYPVEGAELKRRLAGKLPEGWEKSLPRFSAKDKKDATRNLSGKCLNSIAKVVPELIGGSADLTPSNKTAIKSTTDFLKGAYKGNYLRFGVREHGMVAIANGIQAYGCFIPFTATFLNFIEYAFPAVRIAALAGHQQLLVMTHDSIGLGEDGPTHQPIEAVALCRATPNVLTFRPADGNETSGSYMAAMKFQGPSVLCLSRQGLPHLEASTPEKVLKGAYVVVDCANPDVVLIGTGSEVELAINTGKKLSAKGLKVRVVSMPCTELFDQQDLNYRRSVLPPGVPTVAIEALGSFGWEKYAHHTIAMEGFGASAPIKALLKEFGFTPEQASAKIEKMLAGGKQSSKSGYAAYGLLPTQRGLQSSL